MKNLGVIKKGLDYVIKEPQETDDGSIQLIFHKETLRTVYNDFFAKDSDRRIDKAVFDRHLKCDSRVITQNASQRYDQIDSPKKGKNVRSVALNISDWDEVLAFAGVQPCSITPMSVAELKTSVMERNPL